MTVIIPFQMQVPAKPIEFTYIVEIEGVGTMAGIAAPGETVIWMHYLAHHNGGRGHWIDLHGPDEPSASIATGQPVVAGFERRALQRAS